MHDFIFLRSITSRIDIIILYLNIYFEYHSSDYCWYTTFTVSCSLQGYDGNESTAHVQKCKKKYHLI